MNNDKTLPIEAEEHRKETSKMGVELGFPPYHLTFFVARETETETKHPSPPLTPKPNTIEKP